MICSSKEWDTCREEKLGCNGCFYNKPSNEEIEKAHQFISDMEKEGYKYTAYGKEMYIIENVFKPIKDLKTQRDYYKARYLEFNNAFIQGGEKMAKRGE